MHKEGAAVSAQIGHAGPVANAKSNGLPALGAVAVVQPDQHEGHARRDRGRHQAHRRSPRERREVRHRGGFDAVEIHLGHNYFASSFLSPKINKRKDGYGGSSRQPRQGRLRRGPRRARRGRRPHRRHRQAEHARTASPAAFGSTRASRPPSGSRRTAASTPSNSPSAARCSTRCTCSAATPRSPSSPRPSRSRSSSA
ncbi:oxidoreductase [Yinghuangia aomiensis]